MPQATATMNELEERIAAEIRKEGAIPFSRFMEMALYEPGLGYYETHRDIGRSGDFYTSASVGPLFGQLLGFQFAKWLEPIAGEVQLLEAGAHDGRLALDILDYLWQWQPEVYERTTLVLLEPSMIHRGWEAEVLQGHEGKVKWEAEQPKPFRGIFYCNELLDAFPVEKYEWDKQNQTWFQMGVGFKNGKSDWRRMRDDAWNCEFSGQLPNGTGMVEARHTPKFWSWVCDALQEGRAVAIDYFLEREDFFNPPTPNATLRAFHQHRPSDDLLANVGQQDLTASVSLYEIRAIFESALVDGAKITPQEKFLINIFQQTLDHSSQFPEWTPKRLRQFNTLTHPDHLGRAFGVLENLRV